MNFNILQLILIVLLMASCNDDSSPDNLRQEMDKYSAEELPKQDVTVSTFAVDTIAGTRFLSEIKVRLAYGKRSITIVTEYYLGDSLRGKIANGPFVNAQFQGQKMIIDEHQHYQLYYLIKSSDNQLSLFQVKPVQNQLEIIHIDSSSSNRDKWISQIVER